MTILESLSDKKKEEKVRAYLESHLSCKAIDMPQFSPVDCLMVRGDKVAGIEFKMRNISFEEYNTIWLEESKQVALISCKEVWDKAYFAPCFNGELYWIEVADTLGAVRNKGGRTDRGIDDVDWMLDIPMSDLTKVGRVW